MSRGPGRTQQAILDYLASEPYGLDDTGLPVAAATWLIADTVYGHQPDTEKMWRKDAKSTTAQRTTVRRALVDLERAGLVERHPGYNGGQGYWARPATPAERDGATVNLAKLQAEREAEQTKYRLESIASKITELETAIAELRTEAEALAEGRATVDTYDAVLRAARHHRRR